jgi:vacuolar-type H+-ATPase subunit C/Vma6
VSRVSRYGFIFAKTYGVMARSFVGRNYQDLFRLKKVSELYDLLYPGSRQAETPERSLPTELEARIVASSVKAMSYVLDVLPEPPAVLVQMLRRLEYQNVKTLLRGIRSPAAADARLWDLGAYASLPRDAAQNPDKALSQSRFAWVLQSPETPLFQVENALDRDYYARLLELVRTLPAADQEGVRKLVDMEVNLANALWALRLRFFFGMDAQRARGMLIPAGRSGRARPVVMAAFDIPPDSMEDWRRWKLGELLEDQFGESFRAPDPLRAQVKATQMLYIRARKLFHERPFTLGPIAAYFTLKSHEASLLKTAVEALHLGIPSQDALAMVGVR